MKVYMSTASALKHEVVQRTFNGAGIDVQTVPVTVKSGVSEQPMSIEETYEGASNRHRAMKEQIGNVAAGDCLITIESGIFIPLKERGSYFGTTAIIVERDGEEHVGIDADIEFPKVMTDRIPHDYPDLGALVKAEHGATESDPINVFTNGQRTRRGFMGHALANVLVQFEEFAETGKL
jgi:non-canonical (house-cleaning) NTP pyrophosphatase